MMDERIIKFRGKDIETGKWVYGYYARLGNDHFIYRDGMVLVDDDGSYENKLVPYKVDHETVGQFVCGKLYEGDIARDC